MEMCALCRPREIHWRKFGLKLLHDAVSNVRTNQHRQVKKIIGKILDPENRGKGKKNNNRDNLDLKNRGKVKENNLDPENRGKGIKNNWDNLRR